MVELTAMYKMTMTGEAWIGMVIFGIAILFGVVVVILKSERKETATKNAIGFVVCGLLLIGHYFT